MEVSHCPSLAACIIVSFNARMQISNFKIYEAKSINYQKHTTTTLWRGFISSQFPFPSTTRSHQLIRSFRLSIKERDDVVLSVGINWSLLSQLLLQMHINYAYRGSSCWIKQLLKVSFPPWHGMKWSWQIENGADLSSKDHGPLEWQLVCKIIDSESVF